MMVSPAVLSSVAWGAGCTVGPGLDGVAGEALYCVGADVCADGFVGYFLVALPAARLAFDAEEPMTVYWVRV